MTGWKYLKRGILTESEQGPLPDAAFLQLAYQGVVTPKTLVMHPTVTHGEWVEMARIPTGVQRYEEGIRVRQEEKKKKKQEAEELKAIQLKEKRLKSESEASRSVEVFRTPPQQVTSVKSPAGQAQGCWDGCLSVIQMLSWLAVIGGALIGGLITLNGTIFANSAVQQAAAAAMGVALVVIPYCFARAITELSRLTP